jgi:enoyl-CoA hydratase/carnithine racemase
MTSSAIAVEKRGGTAYLRLNRADRGNVISREVLEELAGAAAAINDDADVRVVILTGEGEAFCTGWDLAGPVTEAPPASARREQILGNAFDSIAHLSQPVIAAINGDAISAGLELALACDVRLACAEARFALPETSLGAIPSGGGTQRLSRIVGRAHALDMILTAEPIGAEEALRIGLVSAVVPREELMARAEALAGRIAARGPIAVRYAKEAIAKGLDMTLEQALRFETDLTVLLQTTEDRDEGVRAFLEKRTPKFRGM